MAEPVHQDGDVTDDFEASRFYGNEADGVQYATVDELRHDDVTANEEIADAEVPVPMSSKDRKKEEKRLEKERKEQEKRDKQLLRDQERLIKGQAKLKRSGSSRRSVVVPKDKPDAPPKKAKFRGLKNTVACRVHLLDTTDFEFDINKSSRGELLMDMVYEYANLLEREFFSCYYIRDDTRFWVIADRKISNQIGKLPWVFYFGVKFYSPEPSKLLEDITRYMLCTQLRLDILSGRLPCSAVTSALLGALVAQAEFGDYDPSEHGEGLAYLDELEFCPDQTPELLDKIAQIHRTLRGQSPADAELNFLENVKKLELYGVELQSAKDAELVNISVGVSAMGIAVYRDYIRVNRFPWPVILKMAYKSDKFYMKIRPAELQKYVTTISFKMPNHELAKRFWRLCIEHHSFFRFKQPMDLERSFFSRLGSSRSLFSGRTYYQSKIYASSVQRQEPYFERASSRMLSRSMGGSFMEETSRAVRQKAIQDFDDYNRSGIKEEVGVLAGTGPEASRVAFVKTVRPGDGDPEQDVSYQESSLNTSYNPTNSHQQSHVMVTAEYHHTSHDTSANTSFSHTSAMETDRAPALKQIKTTTVVTEYNSETNGVTETTTERRQVVGRADVDHDVELSKAIHSVMDMSADLSVDKIEINPSMAGTSEEQTFEIASQKTKKPKKVKKSKKKKVPTATLR